MQMPGNAACESISPTSARRRKDVILGDEVYEEGAARERAVRRALEALATVGDPLRRRVYLEDLSVRTNLPAGVLEEQIQILRKKEAAVRQREASRRPARDGQASAPPSEAPHPAETAHRADTSPDGAPAPAARVMPHPDEGKRPPPLERTFVAVLLHDTDLGAQLLEAFAPDQFDHPVTARIIAKAGELSAAGTWKAEALLNAFEQDVNAYALLGELSIAQEYSLGVARQAEDCRSGMERRLLEREMREVMQEMRKAKARGDAERMREFVRRRGELARGIEALRAPKKTF